MITDIAVSIGVGEIDGGGSILARAGPCIISGTGKAAKSRFGIVEFDIADIDRLMLMGTFDGVILHEMGKLHYRVQYEA